MLRMLWDWAIGGRTFDQGIEAAAAGEFDAFSLTWRRAQAEAANSRSVTDLARHAAGNGVRLEFLDGVSCWGPIRVPEDAGPEVRAAFDFSPEQAFDFCGEAGITRIVALGGFNPGDFETARLTESFAEFCTAAALHGLQVVLEPIASIGGLRSLNDVWPIVRDADQSNGSIMLDTWHFMRGGGDFVLLESIPDDKITDLQIVDGPSTPVDQDVWLDGLNGRFEAGCGSLPLERLLASVMSHHRLHSIGPESYHASMDNLAPDELGRQLARSMDSLLARVRQTT